MKRPFLVLSLFCLALFAAIVAGYWNMLDTEKLRAMREQASEAMNEVTAMVGKPEAKPAPEPATPTAETPVSQTPPVSPTPSAEAPAVPAQAADAATAPAATADPQPTSGTKPTFDILRVEPDGSAVMAGRAEPGAKIRLVDGQKTFGETTANGEGAFAIVLDRELPVGDHQIRIEGRTGDGPTQLSDETAVVSIPENGRKDQLLAMVESPDRPSRLIAVPAAEPPAAEQTATLPDASETQAPQETAAATPGPAPSQTAAPAPASSVAAVPSAAGNPNDLAVEAVEIEDGTIYVAGRAAGRGSVRVYVDGNYLAEDAGRDEGRFLVTSKVPVTPGDHLIRADLLNADGTVAGRVEVPFRRPEGETMAAIEAPPVASGQPAAAAPATPAPVAAAPDAATPPSAAPSAPTDTATTTVAPARPTGPEATRQAALEGVAVPRVIIRRGDTLWRISRDVYGRGARFTVIYLANGDQIRNPNRIYPGQVFRVPKDEPAAN